MHSTATEDTGLSESTYELVGSTDTESQDGNYTESMSASLDSLDFHRPDDVVSLAGTEHTFDDESVADVTESQHFVAPNANMEESLQTALLHGESGADLSSNSDDEKASHSSLDYANNSLQTPSLTPEASAIIGDTVNDNTPWSKTWKTYVNHFWAIEDKVQVYLTDAASRVIPRLLFVTFTATVFHYMLSGDSASSHYGFSSEHSGVTTTLTVFATTSTMKTTVAAGQPTSAADSNNSEERLLGPRRATISFTTQGKQDVLVHVQEAVRDIWLAKGCVSATATRDDTPLHVNFEAVPSGILLRFPSKEAYGVVSVSFKATCRPRAKGQVKVHFGKGIMLEAFEKTIHMAQDFSDFVPVAAQEAERRLLYAGKSLQDVSRTLSASLGSLANDWFGDLGRTTEQARVSLQHTMARFTASHGAISDKVFILRQQAQLTLLDSQLKARAWWLRASGRVEEHERYVRAARDFMANKRSLADTVTRQRQQSTTKPSTWPLSWILP